MGNVCKAELTCANMQSLVSRPSLLARAMHKGLAPAEMFMKPNTDRIAAW